MRKEPDKYRDCKTRQRGMYPGGSRRIPGCFLEGLLNRPSDFSYLPDMFDVVFVDIIDNSLVDFFDE